MSHAGHRYGTVEELKDDYVILVKPMKDDEDDEQVKAETIRKTRVMADIAYKNGAVNLGRKIGCIGRGDDYETVMGWPSAQGFYCCFNDKDNVKKTLEEYKKLDYGISIVASGLIEEIFDISKEIGLKPHTILYSLGVWGKTERLPDRDHLKITTRCGHHMISPEMVDHYVEMIKDGSITPQEAGRKLAAPCVCGIFNVPKTVAEIKKMAGK